MRNFIIAGVIAAVAIPAAPVLAQSNRAEREYRRDVRQAQANRNQRNQRNNRDWQRYDHNRPDPRYGNYQADRYYQKGNYKERRLGSNDRIYRGSDNRYYCRRNDGTTGLIIGGLGGGVLGNVIAPGGSKTLGSVLGAGAGALLGRSVDRNNVKCR